MNMYSSLLRRVLIVLGCGVLLNLPLHADDIAQAGRSIVAKYQDSLVTIKIAVKIHANVNGEQNTDDDNAETIGTIIDPSGLIVASLATADPAETLDGMTKEHEEMHITTEIVSLTIRTADGKEMPGKIVLRDKDLDLAFIRPMKKPSAPLTALDLKAGITPSCSTRWLSSIVSVISPVMPSVSPSIACRLWCKSRASFMCRALPPCPPASVPRSSDWMAIRLASSCCAPRRNRARA